MELMLLILVLGKIAEFQAEGKLRDDFEVKHYIHFESTFKIEGVDGKGTRYIWIGQYGDVILCRNKCYLCPALHIDASIWSS